MICPRCSIVEISDETNQCDLCGFVLSEPVSVGRTSGPVDPMLPSGLRLESAERAPSEVDTLFQSELGDHFEIQAVLRHSPRSMVYRVRDIIREESVVLKALLREAFPEVDPSRFERAVARAALVTHPRLVPILDFGTTDSYLWYSTQVIEGVSLEARLRETGPMEFTTCATMARDLAQALHQLHQRDCVHGNVKPSNVLFDSDGRANLSDGVLIRDNKGAPLAKTPEYMAPECFSARVGTAAGDQYALAVLLYECLSGDQPFVGDSPEELAVLHRTQTPAKLNELRDDLPGPIAEVVGRGMARKPGARFPGVLDFADAFGEAAGVATAPGPAHHLLLVEAPPPRPFPFVPVAVGAVLSIGVVGGIRWHQRPPAMQWAELTEEPPPRLRQPIVLPEHSAEAIQADPSLAGPDLPSISVEPSTTDSTPSAGAATSAVRARAVPPRRPIPLIPGRLFINSTPWGQLFIDGVPMGNTPKRNLQVEPGSHVIRIVQYGYEPFELEVLVAQGQEIRMTDITLQARP